MTLIYLVDCHYTIFDSYPARLTVAEMIGDMSSSDEAFAATDALVCEGYLLGTNEEPRVSLAISMQWLMADDWDPFHHHALSTLNLFTLLNCKYMTSYHLETILLTSKALNATIFLLKSSSMWIYNSNRVSHALDRWKILWDNHIKEVGPDFSRSGFFKNSLEFWHLAKLVLKTEGVTGAIGTKTSIKVDIDTSTEMNALMEKFHGVSVT